MSKRWPDKYIVGLTGNIATGKSAVLELAAAQDALAIDADKIVHDLLDNDSAVQEAIEAAFGSALRRHDGRINRERLGAIVFSDESLLAILESIVHPAVNRNLLRMIDESDARIVFIEAIKLLESSLLGECDQIWVTRCTMEVQVGRIMTYRGMDRQTAMTRVAAQPPQVEKVAAADVVIDTEGSMAETVRLFNIAWQRLLRTIPAPIAIQHNKRASKRKQDASTRPTSRGEPRTDPEAYPGSAQPHLYSETEMTRQSSDTYPDPTDTESSAGGNGVTVRRARPSDVPAILWLIRRTSTGAVRTKREELLLSLGERGYLIGQKEDAISAVIGWSSENLVATIDLIIVNPPEAAFQTGAAVLQEIENTANALICEVILAFPPTDVSDEVRNLFQSRGFVKVQTENLPQAWRTAIDESRPDDSLVLMKILRDTRAVEAG